MNSKLRSNPGIQIVVYVGSAKLVYRNQVSFEAHIHIFIVEPVSYILFTIVDLTLLLCWLSQFFYIFTYLISICICSFTYLFTYLIYISLFIYYVYYFNFLSFSSLGETLTCTNVTFTNWIFCNFFSFLAILST